MVSAQLFPLRLRNSTFASRLLPYILSPNHQSRSVEQRTNLLWLYVFGCPLQHNSCSPEDKNSAAGVDHQSWISRRETEMLWAVLQIQFCSSRAGSELTLFLWLFSSGLRWKGMVTLCFCLFLNVILKPNAVVGFEEGCITKLFINLHTFQHTPVSGKYTVYYCIFTNYSY